MSSLQNKLSLKTFGLVYLFEYDFKCLYNTIAPGHLTRKNTEIPYCKSHFFIQFQPKPPEKYFLNSQKKKHCYSFSTEVIRNGVKQRNSV